MTMAKQDGSARKVSPYYEYIILKEQANYQYNSNCFSISINMKASPVEIFKHLQPVI
jgi:hypothetical protein